VPPLAGRSAGAGWIFALLGLAACGPEAPERPPDLLLITVDTLRADHLEPYGSTTTRTPLAVRLAAEGTLFENAAAPMPLTRPSHSTLFTSRHPRLHGVTDNNLTLPERELTLAEVLRQEGYRTAAFIGSSIVGHQSGATQGFEHLDGPRPGQLPPATRVVDRAVRWLRTVPPEENAFVWVHLFDPHLPYDPPEELAPPPGPRDEELPRVRWHLLRALAGRHGGDLDQGALDRARALYAGEVSSADAALEALFRELEAAGRAERTLTVLTADHGECFENGFFFRHGDCLYEGSVRVPLIVHYPGRVAAGERSPAQVSQEDVAPTLLTLAGLPVPDLFEGSPLFGDDGAAASLPADRVALVQYPVSARRDQNTGRHIWDGIERVTGVPMRALPRGVRQFAVRSGRWKYIATTDGAEELYDLEADPAETTDLSSRRPAQLRRCRALLRQRLAELPLTVLDAGELTPEMKEELEAHGYL
jgi:arylsulfatase A-like enzyme